MVKVNVKEGILEGAIVNNEFGGKYYSFKGIPYAEPPVAELRFKAPQPLKPWTGVRKALEHGPVSFQYDFYTKGPPLGSEDCLYLNVYSPEITPKQTLPVMVFFHGGAFLFGSGNDDMYGPQFLVKENVILVTVNYRVEALGFLCLDTKDIPGNAGMKDQVAALRWVKSNISNFGGDPENVTIFGESAGAVSVTFHLISPMAKGLFKRVIAQSGTANCWWSQPYEPRERAVAIARKLGLESEDDKELYNFFKTLPAEKLVHLKALITFDEVATENPDLHFGIVNEKNFGDNERYFYGDVVDALKNHSHEGVDVMAGFCEHEGLLALLNENVSVDKIINQVNELRESLVPKAILMNNSFKDRFEVGRKMKQFYFKNKKVTMENLEQFVNYYGMNMFSYSVLQFHRMFAQKKKKTYLYKFTLKSERNLLGHVVGLGKLIGKNNAICHADDLGYMFNVAQLPTKVDSPSYKMVQNVVKLWTNFAKYGTPTPDADLGVTWSPYTLEKEEYLDIGEKLVPGTEVDKEQFQFWDEIYKKYLPEKFV